MKSIFVCAENDVLRFSMLTLRNPNTLSAMTDIMRFPMPSPRNYPYVSEYLVDFDDTLAACKQFISDELYSGLLRIDFLIALPDDCTSIESHALEEVMTHTNKCKSTITEYKAFLLADLTEYIAVTASKRAITLTHVNTDADETEQIFLDIRDASTESIEAAYAMLDESAKLPVFSYGLPDGMEIGTAVPIDTLIENFVRLQ